LVIGGQNLLNDLSGLENLNSVGGDLTIKRCFALTSLLGLEGLSSVNGTIEITVNPLLNECNSICPFLLNLPKLDRNTTIENNLTGCNSWEEIIINNCAESICEDIIESNAIISSTEFVEYNATRIHLLNGFYVEAGATFEAYICEE